MAVRLLNVYEAAYLAGGRDPGGGHRGGGPGGDRADSARAGRDERLSGLAERLRSDGLFAGHRLARLRYRLPRPLLDGPMRAVGRWLLTTALVVAVQLPGTGPGPSGPTRTAASSSGLRRVTTQSA